MSVKTEPPKTINPQRRKKIRPQTAAWVVIITAFAIFCAIVYSAVNFISDYLSHSTQNISASLEVKRGPVYIARAGQNLTVVAATKDKLEIGDIISTDEQSIVRLDLFDGTRLDINPYTRVQLKDSRVVTTNFVRKEKRLQVNISPTPTDDGRPVVGQVTIWPTDPYSNDYSGLPVIATTDDGARVAFDMSGRSNFVIEVQRTSDNSSRTFITSANTNPSKINIEQVASSDKKQALNPGQRVMVDNGQPPSEITSLQDELIRNNRAFINGLDAWIVQRIESGDLDNVDCRLFTDGERIGDGTITRVHSYRYDDAKDAHECSLRQDLNIDVSRYQNLVLELKLKVIYQSLTGGGVEGSEFPVFIKVGFVDNKGTPFEYFKGFYYAAPDPAQGTIARSRDSIQVKQNEWKEFISEDLLQLRPKPAKIVYITIGSSGHEFEAVFTDLSVEGRG